MRCFFRITYDDGSVENLPAKPYNDVVSRGASWYPGVLPDREPSNRCSMRSDYFNCAVNEGAERAGRCDPWDDDEPRCVGFSWELQGSEEEDCLGMMAAWIKRLGSDFDPERKAADYLHGGLLKMLDGDDARAYEADWKCWIHYIEDPRASAELLLSAAGHAPGWNAGISPS